MRLVALGELVEIVSGATPRSEVAEYWGGDIRWVTPADLSKLNGPYIATTPRTITRAGLASCAATVLPVGSVLLSSRAPIGHVAINTEPMATNQGFKSLVPRDGRLNAKYLYHWLRARTDYLQSLGNGATFKELSKATVERVEIPLPMPDKQRHIAAILDRAEALGAKHRRVIARIEELSQSIFSSVFGEHEYSMERLDSLVDRGDRMNYGVIQPGDDTPGGVPLIRISNLSAGAVDRRKLKHISPDIEARYARSRIRGNEILVSCVGSIGEVSVVSNADIGSNIARAVTRIPISDPVMRSYVAAYLRTHAPQRYFRSELRTVAQPTLNVRQLAATQVPMASRELLESFVRNAEQVTAQGVVAVRALAIDEALFESVRSRAFRGEL
ncbi:restriction endonuclease subunit S [Pseudonocardia abyssalis]|uniref:Restriction endonuclease subunit S n=1 Tax=Pseudonocardia abyssalis TaxID=2792008 RepID=A0ABS6UXR6_9PSEU|nr:restriction endonuclease subunit S [Pseudonocardia abyssalis]MBW0114104.1 restriction endonuclease subunit S [Pseudonocardia abyssalis]MBW0136663.1 restriction endonuclease subunit S [Pseudonocardia abyssalis]